MKICVTSFVFSSVSITVYLLTRYGPVQVEMIREVALDFLAILTVQRSRRRGDTREQPYILYSGFYSEKTRGIKFWNGAIPVQVANIMIVAFAYCGIIMAVAPGPEIFMVSPGFKSHKWFEQTPRTLLPSLSSYTRRLTDSEMVLAS